MPATFEAKAGDESIYCFFEKLPGFPMLEISSTFDILAYINYTI